MVNDYQRKPLGLTLTLYKSIIINHYLARARDTWPPGEHMEPHTHPINHQPLIINHWRHYVFNEYKNSISFSGVDELKIKLPATNTSAPASVNFLAFSSSTPPSTWISALE